MSSQSNSELVMLIAVATLHSQPCLHAAGVVRHPSPCHTSGCNLLTKVPLCAWTTVQHAGRRLPGKAIMQHASHKPHFRGPLPRGGQEPHLYLQVRAGIAVYRRDSKALVADSVQLHAVCKRLDSEN